MFMLYLNLLWRKDISLCPWWFSTKVLNLIFDFWKRKKKMNKPPWYQYLFCVVLLSFLQMSWGISFSSSGCTSSLGSSHSQQAVLDKTLPTCMDCNTEMQCHEHCPAQRGRSAVCASCACMLSCFSVVDSATLWTVDPQASLSIGFSRQEHWSGLPSLPPGDLPDPGIESASLMSPALAGGFFNTSAAWKAQVDVVYPFLPVSDNGGAWIFSALLSDGRKD